MAEWYGFRSRFFCQKLAFNKTCNFPVASFASVGLVFGNAVCDQFFGSHKPGFFQIPRNFFPLGLFRGERQGQPLHFFYTKGDVCRDFFLRVGMVEEGLQKPADFPALGRVMELSCNGFYCLCVGCLLYTSDAADE